MFYTLFTQPLLNALAFFIWLSPKNDLGVAIIFLTVSVRVLLYPLQALSLRSQSVLKRLQPKLDEIKKKFAGLKEKQMEAMTALYREEHINPLAAVGTNLLLLAIQLPILIALFGLFSGDVAAKLTGGLYASAPHAASVTTRFLGIVDLAHPNLIMALIAGVAQFFQMRFSSQRLAGGGPTEGFGAAFQKQSQYLFPILTVVIAVRLPSAMALYWLVFTLTGFLDDLWRMRREAKNLS